MSGWIKIRTAAEILEITMTIQKEISTFVTPFFIMHGNEDRIVDIKGSEMLMNRGGCADKSFVKMEGGKKDIQYCYLDMFSFIFFHHSLITNISYSLS